MTRSAGKLATLVTGLLLLAAPLTAQDHAGSIGYGGGGIWFSDFNAGGDRVRLALETGWVVNAHFEEWFGSRRVGLRLNGAFSQRALDGSEPVDAVDMWLGGGDVMLRLLSARPSRTFSPFVALGGGMVRYNLGSAALRFIEEGAVSTGGAHLSATVSAGFGFDLFPQFSLFGTRSGIRIEAIDHLALNSPFRTPDGAEFDPVHNVRVSLSLLGLIGAIP